MQPVANEWEVRRMWHVVQIVHCNTLDLKVSALSSFFSFSLSFLFYSRFKKLSISFVLVSISRSVPATMASFFIPLAAAAAAAATHLFFYFNHFITVDSRMHSYINLLLQHSKSNNNIYPLDSWPQKKIQRHQTLHEAADRIKFISKQIKTRKKTHTHT